MPPFPVSKHWNSFKQKSSYKLYKWILFLLIYSEAVESYVIDELLDVLFSNYTEAIRPRCQSSNETTTVELYMSLRQILDIVRLVLMTSLLKYLHALKAKYSRSFVDNCKCPWMVNYSRFPQRNMFLFNENMSSKS